MMKTCTLLATLALLGGCSGGAASDVEEDLVVGLDILGSGSNDIAAVTLDVVADSRDDLDVPRDLAFHPETGDLWIVNQGDESTTILEGPGASDQKARHKREPVTGEHFMAHPSSLAFGTNNNMATIHDTDEPTQGGYTPSDFMGPTLWPAQKSKFDAGHFSHLDMLHHSPSGKGIAHGEDNLFWVFDGEHKAITRYDFNEDHGMGGTDHTDGEVAVFATNKFKGLKDGTPSHLELDKSTELLYIADSGNNRIAVLDTASGSRGDQSSPNYDGTDQYKMTGADQWTLVEGADVGMEAPSGLVLHDNMIFVSDAGNPAIYAFDLDGNLIDFLELSGAINGIAFGPDGALWYVDPEDNSLARITP
jgi:hypothetical protein